MNRNRCTADPIRPRGSNNSNGLQERPERVGDLRSAEEKLGELERVKDEGEQCDMIVKMYDVEVVGEEVLN